MIDGAFTWLVHAYVSGNRITKTTFLKPKPSVSKVLKGILRIL